METGRQDEDSMRTSHKSCHMSQTSIIVPDTITKTIARPLVTDKC